MKINLQTLVYIADEKQRRCCAVVDISQNEISVDEYGNPVYECHLVVISSMVGKVGAKVYVSKDAIEPIGQVSEKPSNISRSEAIFGFVKLEKADAIVRMDRPNYQREKIKLGETLKVNCARSNDEKTCMVRRIDSSLQMLNEDSAGEGKLSGLFEVGELQANIAIVPGSAAYRGRDFVGFSIAHFNDEQLAYCIPVSELPVANLNTDYFVEVVPNEIDPEEVFNDVLRGAE